ncbi:hypothetical protein DOTSEDRAFT_74791 [Dothistroma septosporum NZE10]|uniref:Uncharacterized protein n=1 Tax=Dothistroma septosporum (strain NZE10 / CBS 128990) TaxID=675120 RepID=N1PC79_DOTSN|nr:hypothetical protein DOTSEDRAFT_74791 [Dothistroma septosporum NZE10]
MLVNLLLLTSCLASTSRADDSDPHTGHDVGVTLGVVGGCAVVALIFLVARKKHLFVQITPGLGETYGQGKTARQSEQQGMERFIEMLDARPNR